MKKSSVAFFPFTFISADMARACAARFGVVVVYQPARGLLSKEMAALEQEGKIVLRYPLAGDDSRLINLSRRFLDWGKMHQGAAAALKKFAENGFYNQEFAPEIKSEILKGLKEPAADPGPVFNARLFLILAQEYDRQAAELDAELSHADIAARDLFSTIKGGTDENTGFSNGLDDYNKSRDTGGYMTESRLRAWQYLMDADPESPEILVTPSPAAVEALQEIYGDMEPSDMLYEPGRQALPNDGLDMKAYRLSELNRIVCLLARQDE
ncbi:MAG: hypothetical protein ACLFNW_05935 [Desulfobacterales bacterium]